MKQILLFLQAELVDHSRCCRKLTFAGNYAGDCGYPILRRLRKPGTCNVFMTSTSIRPTTYHFANEEKPKMANVSMTEASWEMERISHLLYLSKLSCLLFSEKPVHLQAVSPIS